MRLYISSYSSDCACFKCQYDITLVWPRTTWQLPKIWNQITLMGLATWKMACHTKTFQLLNGKESLT